MLAALTVATLSTLTVATLSSCRRVRTCCRLFMCVTPKGLIQPAETLAHARMLRAISPRLNYSTHASYIVQKLGDPDSPLAILLNH